MKTERFKNYFTLNENVSSKSASFSLRRIIARGRVKAERAENAGHKRLLYLFYCGRETKLYKKVRVC